MIIAAAYRYFDEPIYLIRKNPPIPTGLVLTGPKCTVLQLAWLPGHRATKPLEIAPIT